MLTVPLTTIAQTNETTSNGSIVRAVKDWVAERIASTVLINRLNPRHSYDSSSESENESEYEDNEKLVIANENKPVGTVQYATTNIVDVEDGLIPQISLTTTNNEDIPISATQNAKKLRLKSIN